MTRNGMDIGATATCRSGGSFDGAALDQLPLLDVAPAALYVCNPDGLIQYCNRRAVEIWGRRPRCNDAGTRFCGSLRLRRLDGSLLPHDQSPMAGVLRSRSPVQDEEAIIERPDGTTLIVRASITPVFDAQGNFQGAINCLQDITAGKKREAELVRAQRNLEDFFENGAVGLHWVGPDGTILRANRAELELLGYSAEEYIGRHIADFHVDREVIEDILERLGRNEVLHGYEARLRARDGSIRYVLISSSVLRENGKFIHTRCFTRDITLRKNAEQALRRSEAMFRQLADAMPQIVWTAGPAGRPDYHNKRWYELGGRAGGDVDDIGEQVLGPALHPDDAQHSADLWSEAVASGRTYEIECRLRDARTGQYRWHLARAVPVRDERGSIVRWFGTATDIDDLKKAESELARQTALLRRQAEELARSNADLEDFAYISSHDLKEPLRGISTYAAMLLTDVGSQVDDDSRNKLESLVRLSQRMYKLLDALLEYSRIGRAQLALRETDMASLAGEVVDTLGPMLEEKNAVIRIQPGLPKVICDRTRIGQLLANLFVNAVKYNHAQRPEIEFGALLSPAPGGLPTFYVRDNGIGMRSQHLEAIFRIFKRLHHRDKYGGGAGVGLALAKRIAERHGGRIWAESAPDQGSTFYFTLGDPHAGEAPGS